MESIAIANAVELRAEIHRLKVLDTQQKAALVSRFNSPAAAFATARSLFSKPDQGRSPVLVHPDILKLVSRFVIPLVLNKTIFRHSNFLIKALVGLVSQKAAGMVTERSAEHLFAEGKSLIGKLIDKVKPAPPRKRIRVYEQV